MPTDHAPRSLSLDKSWPSDLRGWAFDVLIVATVLAAVAPSVVYFAERQAERALLIALVAVCHVSVGVLAYRPALRTASGTVTFVVGQIVLLTVLLFASRGFGGAEIAIMPSLVQFTLVLNGRLAWSIGALMLAIIGSVHVTYGQDVGEVLLFVVPGFGTAVAFGILFAQLVRREADSRRRVEELNEQLAVAAAEREELAATRERNRLARDIHDGLGHTLTVLHAQLDASEHLIGTEPDRARELVARSRRLTKDGLDEVRRSVAALRRPALDGAEPLAESVHRLVDEVRTTGLDVELDWREVDGVDAPRDDLATVVFRGVQEALTNVQKHAAGATRADVSVELGPERASVRVVDDGCGPAESNGASTGFGLLGMRERARLLGGELRHGLAAGGRGFAFELEVPR